MPDKLDDKKFCLNLATLFGVVLLWVVLDLIFGKQTDLTDLLIIGFFLVWNANVSRKAEAV